MNITTFLRKNPIHFAHRPFKNYKGDFQGDHYKVTLTRNGFAFTTEYHKGTGHNGAPPTLVEVLDSLASDASSADQKFEQWAADYGYDTDSRKAFATYNACRRIARNLKALLGPHAFDTLIHKVDRC